MPRVAKEKSPSGKDSTSDLGFEAELWLTADKLRNNMDAAEYKHAVLGLIFLKYISDPTLRPTMMRRACAGFPRSSRRARSS